jgi:hypothetical protein
VKTLGNNCRDRQQSVIALRAPGKSRAREKRYVMAVQFIRPDLAFILAQIEIIASRASASNVT